MGRVLDTIGGVYQLARLGVVTRFKLKGEYWQWRMHTAFGAGGPPSRGEALHAVLEYGRWVHRMRRLSR